MSLLPFIEWCDRTAIAVAIRDSAWLFPVIESVHLLALALLGGAVLIVDLRLLGFGLRRPPLPDLARELRPWMMAGLIAMIVSGVLMFLSEALKCYENPPFRLKMLLLCLALLFTFTVRQRVALSQSVALSENVALSGPATARGRWPARLTAVVSLTLWTGVGLTGRGIGFW